MDIPSPIERPTTEEAIRIINGPRGLKALRDFHIQQSVNHNRPDLSSEAVNLYEYDHHHVMAPGGIVGRSSKKHIKGPANVVFLTSIRDIGKDDRNGLNIIGIIETVNWAINNGILDLEDYIRIRGIITDDLETDDRGPYPSEPKLGKPWIHPLEAKNDKGEKLTSITEHIPSSFRITPEKVRQNHLEFEREVFKVSQQMGADIIVSDHLMVRIIHLIDESRYGLGRVLNIHPGITDTRNPNRLPGSTPTRDAIDRAKSGHVYDKKTGLFLQTEPTVDRSKTGASLHVVNKEYDGGPVIADSEATPVSRNDTPQELREKNYPTKRTVFILGIIHYVRTMLNRIEKIDFNSDQRDQTKTRII